MYIYIKDHCDFHSTSNQPNLETLGGTTKDVKNMIKHYFKTLKLLFGTKIMTIGCFIGHILLRT